MRAAPGALAGLLLATGAGAVPADTPRLNWAQSQYLLRCGGCHGTLGLSPPRSVPILREQVGWFLCTAEGREYLVRLPNVAQARLDDTRLADLLNFVTFELGGRSVPADATRFTPAEVGAIRARPLTNEPLLAHRRRVVLAMMRQCNAPRSLLDYGEPHTVASRRQDAGGR